jgi:DNA-binding NtrC family response regulator
MRVLQVVVPPESPLHEALRQFKRDFITMTLRATGGNRSEAARRLGIQRTYLHRLIRELQIEVPPPQGRPDRPAPRRKTL